MLAPDPDMGVIEELPLAFSSGSTNSVNGCEWWKTFSNSELNSLISEAFSSNLSFAQSAARFRQAEATAARFSASASPSISAAGSLGKSEQQRETDSAGSERLTADVYSLGLAASYELDLWGRVYSVRKSSALRSQASLFDLETAAVTLAARIAEVWLQAVESATQLEILSRQTDSSRDTLDILRKRAVSASATMLDVYQQEQLLKTAEARLPAAQQKLELLQNELDILTGRPAGTGQGITTRQLPVLPPLPDIGIPADLLANRPDLKAQLLRLKASGYDVAAARADRLPAIRLSGKYEYSAGSAAALFDNWLSSLAAGLSAPVIDGGMKRAEVRRTMEAMTAELAAYRETILQAFRDVEDSLVREKRTAQTADALQIQLSSSLKALDEARRRYMKGNTGYLPVLASLRSAHQAEMDLTSARTAQLQARIALHRAIAGSWTSEYARHAAHHFSSEKTNDPGDPK